MVKHPLFFARQIKRHTLTHNQERSRGPGMAIELDGKKVTAKQYAREVMLLHLMELWNNRSVVLSTQMTQKEEEEVEKHLSLDEERVIKTLPSLVDKEYPIDYI
jgi:hypothetical protein